MAQHMHTVCLRSSDASVLDEGTYQWSLVTQNLKVMSRKLLLASVELPMSQWSIEEAWNRVYVVERLLVTPQRRRIDVREEAAGAGALEATVLLPLHLNTVRRLRVAAGVVTIETEEPHGLSGAIFDWLSTYEEHAKLVASAVDTVDLSAAWSEGRLTVDSERKFSIRPRTASLAASETVGGYVYFPSPPTPAALADAITAVVQATGSFGRRFACTFDADDCALLLSLAAYPSPDAAQVRLTVGGDALASLVGLAGASRVFTRQPLDPRTAGMASAAGRGFLQQNTMSLAPAGDAPPLTLRGDAAALFGHARVRPGWYAPSQRIYSTSPPLRLPAEWELQFDRFVFPGAEGGGQQPGLVYTDPFGVDRIAEVSQGVYTAESVAALLTHMMNQEAEGYAFAVRFEKQRFTISCAAGGVGLAFSVHFTHPRSVDAAKFGFEEAVLEGSDSYRSSVVVHAPTTPFGRLVNLYQITEVHGQRKFCIRPSAAPPVVGIAETYDVASRTLRLRCVTPAKRPVSHGMQRGTVVAVGASGFVQDGEDRQLSVPTGSSTLAVVSRGTEAAGVTIVEVEVPPLPWVVAAAAGKKCMRLTQATEPCSFCFCDRLPASIGGERLGFASTTVQWGLDGAVATRRLRIPPFVSPRSHNLDHVDFVLLRIRESQKSALMQYETNGQSVSIFGKICLNPTFRHERHLPVELSLEGGDRLDLLTLEVLNPDLTRYHFHGATWSLALSFVT